MGPALFCGCSTQIVDQIRVGSVAVAHRVAVLPQLLDVIAQSVAALIVHMSRLSRNIHSGGPGRIILLAGDGPMSSG